MDIAQIAGRYWIEALFGAMCFFLAAGYKNLSARTKKDRATAKAVQDGVIALLSDRTIQLHNYYLDKGYCPIYAKKSAEQLYNAYHALGGNGTISELYNRLMAMPTERKEEPDD